MSEVAGGWRPKIAVFANPDARAVAAALMLGQDTEGQLEHLSPSRRAHIQNLLLKSGFVAQEGDELRFVASAFEEVLRSNAAPPRRGVERFLSNGRITTYPAKPADREALLRHVAVDVLAPDEVVSEASFNERLLPYSSDVAVLRRHLVDFGIVERSADGSSYTLSQP